MPIPPFKILSWHQFDLSTIRMVGNSSMICWHTDIMFWWILVTWDSILCPMLACLHWPAAAAWWESRLQLDSIIHDRETCRKTALDSLEQWGILKGSRNVCEGKMHMHLSTRCVGMRLYTCLCNVFDSSVFSDQRRLGWTGYSLTTELLLAIICISENFVACPWTSCLVYIEKCPRMAWCILLIEEIRLTGWGW